MFLNLIILICVLKSFVIQLEATNHVDNHPECDEEEEEVEQCAKKMTIIGRQRMPQTVSELEFFCSNYKNEENCLRNHSIKCLSPSAHQTVTMLINSVVAQNQKICSNGWRNKKRIMNGAKCSNKHNDKPVHCLQDFIDKIQGIHQLTQNDKIPIICCNYHKYRKCATDYLSTDDRICNDFTVKTIQNMIDGYSGDVINFVCDSYRHYGTECNSIADLNISMSNSTKEEIPKSFFSLMVKIYLS